MENIYIYIHTHTRVVERHQTDLKLQTLVANAL
jgi:hypothetical protein